MFADQPSRITAFAFLIWGAVGCAQWPQGALHPHEMSAGFTHSDNPLSRSTLRSEWRAELGLRGPFLAPRGFIGGVGLHERYPLLAIVGYDRNLRLINRKSGVELWRSELKGVGVGEPLFYGDLLITPTDDGLLTAYDINQRAVIWRRQFAGLVRVPLTLNAETLFVCDGTNSVYAIKAETGEVLWQHKHEVPVYQSESQKFTLQGEARPQYFEGKLFVGFSDGQLVALNAQRGEVIWKKDLAPQLNQFEDVDADVAIVGDTLYAASAASGLYALSLKDGSIKWFFPQEGIITLAGFEGDLILGLQHGEVGRFSPTDRAFRWRVSFGTDGAPLRPLIFPHGIAFTLSRGGLYVLDAHTGELRDQFTSGSGLQGHLALSEDGWMYATSLNGFVYSFSPR